MRGRRGVGEEELWVLVLLSKCSLAHVVRSEKEHDVRVSDPSDFYLFLRGRQISEIEEGNGGDRAGGRRVNAGCGGRAGEGAGMQEGGESYKSGEEEICLGNVRRDRWSVHEWWCSLEFGLARGGGSRS
ncbi:unnamed protein product [Calypogeia fissa]